MIITCWSPKAGSGTSVVAAAIAGLTARSGRRTFLIDLGGDSAAILGLPTPTMGISDVVDGDGAHSLLDIAVTVSDNLDLVSPGLGQLPQPHVGRWSRIESQLVDMSASGALVVIDAGVETYPDWVKRISDRVHLVIRPCYVALKRAVEHKRSDELGDGVIVVSESDRALTARDVTLVLNLPIVAEVPVHADISRRVDAGLLNSHIPDRLVVALSGLVKDLV